VRPASRGDHVRLTLEEDPEGDALTKECYATTRWPCHTLDMVSLIRAPRPRWSFDWWWIERDKKKEGDSIDQIEENL
jgi:hypothetical protein